MIEIEKPRIEIVEIAKIIAMVSLWWNPWKEGLALPLVIP